MTRLDAARRRLADALAGLEKSVSVHLGDARGEARPHSELERLREERERLLARIAELEGGAEELAGLSGEIETRLDGAIADLRNALAAR